MGRGLRAVAAVVGAIGLAQISGGVAMTTRSGPAVGLVVAGLGTTLVVLAVILVRITRRASTNATAVAPDAAHVSPTMEMPFWTPRHVPPHNGEASPRSTWAMLESMRADAIKEAAKEAQAREEAARREPPRGLTPPE